MYLAVARTSLNTEYLLANARELRPPCGAKKLLSYSRNSKHFMESKGKLPYPQEPTTGLCPQPDESSPHPSFLFLSSMIS
jgi:hypothetical protein